MASGPDHYREAERLVREHQDALNAFREGIATVKAQALAEHEAWDTEDLRAISDMEVDGAKQVVDGMAWLLDLAQVHATLALAAATATQLVGQFVELDEDAFAWNEVAGTPPRGVEDVPLP
jgi:hypothetical protein